MQNVLLTIHMIACIALVIAIMLQRSEGGALGMSGGGTGGLISGRGAAGMLVKVTMGLALIFFVTSITMTWLHNQGASQGSILERQADEAADPFDALGTSPSTPAPVTDPLGAAPTTTPAAPAPAAPAPTQSTAPDPLAPSTATPPAATTPAPAPATTTPTTPAPTPENGGSPN